VNPHPNPGFQKGTGPRTARRGGKSRGMGSSTSSGVPKPGGGGGGGGGRGDSEGPPLRGSNRPHGGPVGAGSLPCGTMSDQHKGEARATPPPPRIVKVRGWTSIWAWNKQGGWTLIRGGYGKDGGREEGRGSRLSDPSPPPYKEKPR